LVLARTDRAAIALVGATAYPTGFKVFLTTRLNPVSRETLPGRRRDFFMLQRLHETELPDELLRFGVQLADGRKATNLAPMLDYDEEPAGPTLTQRGGGGSGTAWNQSFWVWPLPPPGPLEFVCEWPAFDIPECRAAIDAALVLDAAKRAETLWPDQPPSGGVMGLSGSFGSS
jgi:hypothetical protein